MKTFKELDKVKIYANGKTFAIVSKLESLGFVCPNTEYIMIDSYPFIFINGKVISLDNNMISFRKCEYNELSCSDIFDNNFYSSELLPLTDFDDVKNVFDTFQRLVLTCNAWNKVTNYKADWDNEKQAKYSICNDTGKVTITDFYTYHKALHFETQEIADEFLKIFREEIELIKELI